MQSVLLFSFNLCVWQNEVCVKKIQFNHRQLTIMSCTKYSLYKFRFSIILLFVCFKFEETFLLLFWKMRLYKVVWDLKKSNELISHLNFCSSQFCITVLLNLTSDYGCTQQFSIKWLETLVFLSSLFCDDLHFSYCFALYCFILFIFLVATLTFKVYNPAIKWSWAVNKVWVVVVAVLALWCGSQLTWISPLWNQIKSKGDLMKSLEMLTVNAV